MSADAAGEVRLRILDGAARCIQRWSVSKATLSDVAVEAGVSRATLYRAFPGGRDELLQALVQRELAVFFGRLAEVIADAADLATLLTDGLVAARLMVSEHELYQRVMATEPELILPLMTVESVRLRETIGEYLRPWVERAGVAPGPIEALLDYLSRMVLSFIESPGGWDMADREVVARLVDSRFMAPIRHAAGKGA